MLTSFNNMLNEKDSAPGLYYGEAPSAMATRPDLLVDFGPGWAAFTQPPPMPIATLRLFYVHVQRADGFHGGLIISGNGQGTTVTASPVPSASPTAPVTTAGPGWAYIALNDGNNGTMPGTIDGDFQIEMTLSYPNGSTDDITLQSDDVSDGDLTDTIQFKMYRMVNGESQYMGLLNLTTPQ
jgi:hypothetical protein